MLSVGNGQTLSATFTPNDTSDYTGATASVKINIQPTSPPSSPAKIVITKTLARDPDTNQVVVNLNVSNAGGTAAQNVQLTIGKINTTSGTPLPQSLGIIPAGGSITAILRFPGSVGNAGATAALIIGGTYSGGSFNTAAKITLP